METLVYVRMLAEGKSLSFEEAKNLMDNIGSGGAAASEAQMGALLAAMDMREPTVEELAGFATSMRERASRINANVTGRLVDISRTGGSYETIDISTICGFVVAGAGVPVAKHGNRTVSGTCGPADLIEALGADIMLDGKKIAKAIESIGIAFLFAPVFHPSMRCAAQIRKQLKARTIFSILGPLTNPAGVKNIVLGVSKAEFIPKMIRVLKMLNYERALVVGGAEGFDAISIAGESKAAELNNGEVKEYAITPEELGIKTQKLEGIDALEPLKAAELCRQILGGVDVPAKNVVLANSAACIYISGACDSLKEGIEMARKSIESGKAMEKLNMFIAFSNSLEYDYSFP